MRLATVRGCSLLAVFVVCGLASRAGAAPIFAVGTTNGTAAANSSPSTETAPNVSDANSATKYLNFIKLNAGFIESFPAAVLANGINFTTANDSPERDPLTFSVYGSNGTVVTGSEAPGTTIDLGTFTPIASNAATNLSTTRLTSTGDQPFSNTTAYRTYAVIFPTVRNATTANSMQVADAIFDAAGVALPGQASNKVVGGAIPEPASAGLLALSAVGLLARRRRFAAI